MQFELLAFTPAGYDEAVDLWAGSEGVPLRALASRGDVERYLKLNPGRSFVARSGGRMVGAVLAGHDGRRGILNHLAVAADCRRLGIGRVLALKCAEALAAEGIDKCHV